MRIGLSVCPEAGRWHDTVEQAQLAAELGFDSVWLPEHHLMAGYIPSPMLGLAGLIGCTGQMQLGTNIAVAPFYHPVRLAEDAALLQDMSGGRFILGLGLGYRESEFEAFGVSYRERAGRLAETLKIVRQLMSAERVTFGGRYFNLAEVTIYPRLATPPPLWVGGWSRTAVNRAAELGDVWFPGPTADVPKVADSLRWYDEALAERGQTRHELPIFRELWVADSEELMAAGVEPMRRLYSNDYVSWKHANVDGAGDIAADRFLIGNPEQVAGAIVSLRERLGVTHLIARLHSHGVSQAAVKASMRLLAERVRPLVEQELTRRDPRRLSGSAGRSGGRA